MISRISAGDSRLTRISSRPVPPKNPGPMILCIHERHHSVMSGVIPLITGSSLGLLCDCAAACGLSVGWAADDRCTAAVAPELLESPAEEPPDDPEPILAAQEFGAGRADSGVCLSCCSSCFIISLSDFADLLDSATGAGGGDHPVAFESGACCSACLEATPSNDFNCVVEETAALASSFWICDTDATGWGEVVAQGPEA